MKPSVTTHVIDFGNPDTKEAVALHPDGKYTIFLNACFTNEDLVSAYLHACDHILKGDFHRHTSADLAEKLAHSREHPVGSHLTEIIADFIHRRRGVE